MLPLSEVMVIKMKRQSKNKVSKGKAKQPQSIPAKNRLLNILPFAFPPILVMCVILYAYYIGYLYPFGEGSVSWCDMNQQTIPLLIDFKDILDGKSSMFLNFENAGGMNFWGVFFFFLSSPFTLLVKFIDKSNMILFVNILVMLKMMTASLTAMIYFKACHKQLDTSIAVILSFMYGVCGYGMVFYQNIIWLDMMYLLPLLLLSLNLMVNKGKVLPYVIVLAATVIVNYYISYMIVVFLLLFMGIYVLMHSKNETKEVCVHFLGGSLAAALISAVVWIPCFMQYLTSGRGESIIENIANSKFITDYYTTLPLVFCTAFVFVTVIINAFSGEKREKEQNMYLYLFILTLIPLIIEPINKMWHTGSYMSFPMRYGFITMFLGLICCAGFLSRKPEFKGYSHLVLSIAVSGILIYIFITFSDKYITDNYQTLTNYTQTLWGNEGSFRGLLQLFVVAVVCYGVIYLFYKHGCMVKQVFVVLICIAALAEAYSNARIYMLSPSQNNPQNVQSQQSVLELADKINDDSFYRVKTSSKLFDYNLVGSLGYPSLSHYTSLTDEDYMFTMKRLGYTSVWMEIGSCGGTSLTDALLCADYEITNNLDDRETVYTNNRYHIQKTDRNTGLGLITSQNLSDKEEIPEGYERSDVQKYIYSSLFGSDDAVTKYDYVSKSESLSLNGNYNFSGSGTLFYNINVSGRQKLYFDCFDKLTNNLSEPIYNSFSVVVNGTTVQTSYPYNKNNGVLYLGEFENEQVTVQVTLQKNTFCSSFGVFGIDEDALDTALNNTSYVDFNRDGGTLTGSCNAGSGETCFLSVPYNDGFKIKINGEKIDYKKAFSSFISFPLNEGNNDIVITYTPKGFAAGLIITITGIGLTAAYIIFRKKIVYSDSMKNIAHGVVLTISIIAMCLIYAAPLLINILM